MSRKEELIAQIQHHDQCYWEKKQPEITDVEYDTLIRELRTLDPEHPLIHQIHDITLSSTADKVQHRIPMLSLDKAYSLEEVMNWARKYARSENERFLIQPKYDGVSATYENGILATRGDGREGKNISDKLPIILADTQAGIAPLGTSPLRGELVIRTEDFKKIWQEKIKLHNYKNARNTVAGILTMDDVILVEQLRFAQAFILLVDYNKYAWEVALDEIENYWATITAEIENLPYPMDGIVIKLADQAYADELGATEHHPRGQIAFKFTNIRKASKLIGVTWSFGKNCLTPIAQIEPVEIGGITIKNATLHNIKNIEDRDIHIGDSIIVERAGDVIPYIVESSAGETRLSPIITHCPECGTALIRRGVELCCPNPDCPGTKLQRLTAAVKNLGIENLGEPTIKKLIHSGKNTLKDILNLKYGDLMGIEGFADLSIQNLLKEIERAKTPTESQLIASLNIVGVGQALAKKILEQMPFENLRTATPEMLEQLSNVGPERAKIIHETFQNQKDDIDELIACVHLQKDVFGKLPTICFTGKMPKKRDFYAQIAKQKGFLVVDDVHSDTTLLVCADPSAPSSKLSKAHKYNIQVMALNDWMPETMIQEPEEEQDDLFGGLL